MMIIFYPGKLLHVDYFSNDDDYFCWPFGIHVIPVYPLLTPSAMRAALVVATLAGASAP